MTVIELAIKLAINKLYSEIERQLTFRGRRGRLLSRGLAAKFHKCNNNSNSSNGCNNNIDSRQLLQKDGGRQKACSALSGRSDPSELALGLESGLRLDCGLDPTQNIVRLPDPSYPFFCYHAAYCCVRRNEKK